MATAYKTENRSLTDFSETLIRGTVCGKSARTGLWGSGKVTTHSTRSSEKDNEISGEGNTYSTYFRELDVRLGRWFAIDPKTSLTPWESPYVSMGDNPIDNIDPNGDWFWECKEVQQARRFKRATGGDFVKFSRRERKDNGGMVGYVVLNPKSAAYMNIANQYAKLVGKQFGSELTGTEKGDISYVYFFKGVDYSHYFYDDPVKLAQSVPAIAIENLLQEVVIAVPGVEGFFYGDEEINSANVAQDAYYRATGEKNPKVGVEETGESLKDIERAQNRDRKNKKKDIEKEEYGGARATPKESNRIRETKKTKNVNKKALNEFKNKTN